MSERDAFVAAIIADPANDLPRLVFADWLMEHDEPERAEFIRVMCRIQELANEMCGQCHDRLAGRQHTNGPCRCTPRIKSLVRRERELYGDHCEEWHKPDGAEYTWKRGFVAEVYCSLSVWLEHGPRLVREHPIEVVNVTDLHAVHLIREPVPEVASAATTILGSWLDAVNPQPWPDDVRHQIERPYRTEQEAKSALSGFLIAWAKSQPVPITPASAIG